MKDIAVIGVSCHFPGAENKDQFWNNLKQGVDSTTRFTRQELLDAGEKPELLNDPDYVMAAPIVKDYDKFDANFFGYSPSVAELMNPEARLMLQCAWETLEDAGYVSEKYKGAIGVYAGALMHNYYKDNICSTIDFEKWSESIRAFSLNEKEYLTTIIADRLHLKGPAVTLQSFCSTSLMVIHYACQDIISGTSDIALAGGINIRIPHERGHIYEEGGMQGPYDHCKVFDEKAAGTIFGSGYGMVALKRLDRAIEDNDHIYAVIKGTSVNNDGGNKLSFMGPSISGQSEVTKKCINISGIDPQTIGYVEAHGTGTDVGDRIEYIALSKALKSLKKNQHKCPIGSVKTNIGHLGISSGIAGFIKTVLTIHHKGIPANLYFDKPNPHIRYEESPFYVNTEFIDWEKQEYPRRAVVCSQGVGGTNACAVLEEAPEIRLENKKDGLFILPFSAKTNSALKAVNKNLEVFIKENEIESEPLSYTLCCGRKQQEKRNFVIGKDRQELLSNLGMICNKDIVEAKKANQSVVFMFPGQGSQHIDMGYDLYLKYTNFRKYYDQCADILNDLLNKDIRNIVFNHSEDHETATEKLKTTRYAQPAIFSLEYSLARFLVDLGIEPAALIGHSVGEFVAATLAGTIGLEDALRLIVKRGELCNRAEAGGMLSVSLGYSAIQPYLHDKVSVGAINSPFLTIVSGPYRELEKLKEQLEKDGKNCNYLHASHAFHSYMMQPMLDEFISLFERVTLQKPGIPIMSTVTGQWLNMEEAISPQHWADNVRNTVRFSEGITKLLEETDHMLLEVGPGTTLATLTKCHKDPFPERTIVTSLKHASDNIHDDKIFLTSLGKIWSAGIKINWDLLFDTKNSQKISLPTYPFEKKRFWIDINPTNKILPVQQEINPRYYYRPSWKEGYIDKPTVSEKSCVLFNDGSDLSKELSEQLSQNNSVINVFYQKELYKQEKGNYLVDTCDKDAFKKLFDIIITEHAKPDQVVYLWNKKSVDSNNPYNDFFTLLGMVKALGKLSSGREINMLVVSVESENISGNETVEPLLSLSKGIVKVAATEYSGLQCKHIDVQKLSDIKSTTQNILIEMSLSQNGSTVAYRNNKRWERYYETTDFNPYGSNLEYKDSDIYLVTGGLGGLGFEMAKHIASSSRSKIILTGRTDIDNQNDSIKQERFKQLKSLNNEIEYHALDIANDKQVGDFAREVIKKHHHIKGIFHCAGNPGGGIIELKTKEMALKVLDPKVIGTSVLYKYFKDSLTDFLLLFSSVASIKSLVGQVEYTAANAFLDAFAQSVNDPRVVNINWDLWGQTGMGFIDVPASMKKQRGIDLAKGIKTAEGISTIENVLSSRHYNNLIVLNEPLEGTSDTNARIQPASRSIVENVPEKSVIEKNPDIEKWFYTQTWNKSHFPFSGIENGDQTWLVFAGNSQICRNLIENIGNRGHKVITVNIGDEYNTIDAYNYVLNPGDKSGYVSLVNSLKENDLVPGHILHFWTVNDEIKDEVIIKKNTFRELQSIGIYSAVELLQELNTSCYIEELKFTLITRNIYNVTGYEKLNPQNATILGLLKVTSLEYPNIIIRNIDLDSDSQNALQLYNELYNGEYKKIKAVRNDKCWVQSYDHINLQNLVPGNSIVKDGGVYLISGGLDVVGYRVAEFMSRTFKIKLALVGEMKTHKWDKWNNLDLEDDSSDAIRAHKLEGLKKFNPDIDYYSIDITSAEAWNETIDAVTAKWGTIDGIVHAAATLDPSSFKPINNVTSNEFEEHFNTKVYASLIITDIIEKHAIQQCLFVSSVSSILGGIEFVTYSSVNNFLDNFVNYLKYRFKEKTIALLNLDELQFNEKEEKITRYGKELQRLSISGNELHKIFSYFLTEIRENQLVISTSELLPRLEKWHGLHKKVETVPETSVSSNLVTTTYDIKQELVNIWQEILGFDTIQITDNFYALGGDSLLATSMVNRMRKKFGNINISIGDILDKPTIEQQEELVKQYYKPTQISTTLTGNAIFDVKDEIISIWKQTLGFDSIDPNSNFYALGGDSLLATSIVNKLRQKFSNIDISIGDILDNPTVEKQEKLIGQLSNIEDEEPKDVYSQYIESEKAERFEIVTNYFISLLKQSGIIETNNDIDKSINRSLKLNGIIYSGFVKDFKIPIYENEILLHTSYRELLSAIFTELEKFNGFADLGADIEFEAAIPDLKPGKRIILGKKKNPSMVFVHSAPRSGSTLFRLMLEGHEKLFSPPEFQLLNYNDLAHWNSDRVKITKNYSGLAFSLAKIHNTNMSSANSTLDQMVAKSLSIKDAYKTIQSGLEGVTLVDKSPNYAIDINHLAKAEEIFDRPKHIHLVRHPFPVIESFVRNRMFAWFNNSEGINPYKFAEKIWYLNNFNLFHFKEMVSADQYLLVCYENLVSNPEDEMKKICSFLDIEFNKDMLSPYTGQKMIDGCGDPTVGTRNNIDKNLAEIWKTIDLPISLSKCTIELMGKFGYTQPESNEADLSQLLQEEIFREMNNGLQ